MTSKEINRKNLTAFVCRALNRAGASAVDLEFGLRLHEYETWEAMILSDQVPADEVAKLLEANPAFAVWYRARTEARKSPKES